MRLKGLIAVSRAVTAAIAVTVSANLRSTESTGAENWAPVDLFSGAVKPLLPELEI